MKIFIICILTACAQIAAAQERVAEGEYQIQGNAQSGVPVAKTATRWALYGKASGGYRLESSIERQPAGMSVLQIEELTEQFVPTLIGYELHRGDGNDLSMTARCDFSTGAVICSGNSGKDQSAPSDPYKLDGPFWMWIEGLFSLDIPWLFDGALSMATHADNGKVTIETLIVSGGSGVMIGDAISVAKLEAIKRPGQTLTVVAPTKPMPWSFNTKDKISLQFVGSEKVQFNGADVTAKHYGHDEKSPNGIWIAGGLVLKLSLSKDSTYVLANYKQYRKLIPELSVEASSPKKTSVH